MNTLHTVTRTRLVKNRVGYEHMALPALQLISSALILFVPEGYIYREIVIEAGLVVSKVLSLLTNYTSKNDDYSSWQNIVAILNSASTESDAIVVSTTATAISQTISMFEILIERIADMFAGKKLYYQLVLAIESIKASSRLIVLGNKKDACMIINWLNNSDENSTTDNTSIIHYRSFYRALYLRNQQSTLHPPTPITTYIGRRSGISLNTPSDQTAINQPMNGLCHAKESSLSVCSEVTEQDDIEDYDTRSTTLTNDQMLKLGEILYIVRPVVYAWTLQFFNRDELPADHPDRNNVGLGIISDIQRRLFAWFVSLLVELASIQLTTRSLLLARQQAYIGAQSRLPIIKEHFLDNWKIAMSENILDKELSRRKAALMFYLIRSPLFERATIPTLMILKRLLQYIPIIRSIPENIIDILRYLNRSYFRSSSSS